LSADGGQVVELVARGLIGGGQELRGLPLGDDFGGVCPADRADPDPDRALPADQPLIGQAVVFAAVDHHLTQDGQTVERDPDDVTVLLVNGSPHIALS
jgi:hypothetical protein